MFFRRFPLHVLTICSLSLPLIVGVAAQTSEITATRDDPNMTPFVDSLLRQMTVSEKVEQMEQAAGQPMFTPPQKADQLARGGVGSFLFFTDPVRINQLQHIAMTESRLHIPLLFGYDVIHGFRTIAPIPLAMASSWNPSLVEQTQSMAAREARAAGIQWAFAPMVDIARDARWGRIMEGAGEDPFLGEQMAIAQVHGFQGPYVGVPDHMLVSVKHFAGYGAATGGRDYDSADISDELLQNIYLPPFKAAVKAGAATMMSAYMNLNGVPATANTWLLQDELRNDWHFKGFVVSDWEAVHNLTTHGFAADDADAALRAALAGVNMEMTGDTYRRYLPAAVTSGKISVAQIDALVRPILEMKYRLGLFKDPYVDLARFQRETLSNDQRAAVRHAAEETAVLLKNEDHILPLSQTTTSLAIIGPLADSHLDTMGSWAIHGDRRDTITIAQGLRERLPNTLITVSNGVEIERGSRTIFDDQVIPERPTLTTEDQKKAAFDKAVNAAKEAAMVVMVLGEAQTMSGENASRGSLALPGDQEKLLEAVSALGKPIVLVLMTGRPLDITWASTHVGAILNAWYPGTEGGHAVASLLLGDTVPSGHLTVTWPRNAGQEPLFYNSTLPQNPQNTRRRYWDLSSSPLYPFGYGLSYASFTIDDLQLSAASVPVTGAIRASVTIRNQSTFDAAEVVQLYTHQRAGIAARPIRELKAFRKVWLKPGESRQVQLEIPAKELSYWSSAKRTWVLEKGPYDLWVGDDSTAQLHATFELYD
jgi:beta-glucosidase